MARCLRFFSLTEPDDDRSSWTPFRSDVDSAYRNLEVCLEAQFLQAIQTRRYNAAGKPEWEYRLDHRVCLGGRLSPVIWCTLLNLLNWIVQKLYGLAHPLAFVDDQFGLDRSGILYPVLHPPSGVSYLFPLDQARVLLLWNAVRIPWAIEKQDHLFSDGPLEGSEVIKDARRVKDEQIVLGFVFNVVAMTVALPQAAKDGFA
ncbi:hypothetical protein JCM10213_003399, partial [Rhodosporidiobolus nylandii]